MANGHLVYAGIPTAAVAPAPFPTKPPDVPRPFLFSPEPPSSLPEDPLSAPRLSSILKELRYVAQRFRSQDVSRATCSQWKFAAAVIDRLCLVLFALFHIVCSIAILMAAPNFAEAITKDFL